MAWSIGFWRAIHKRQVRVEVGIIAATPAQYQYFLVTTAVAAPEHSSKTFSRPTWAEVDLSALQFNARMVTGAHGRSTPLIAVIKADAYGHGAAAVARALITLPEVRMLAVASVDEARVLREAAIETPILLLSAILPEEAEAAIELELTPTLSTLEVARALHQAAQHHGNIASAHFKIDTGMGRLGFPLRDAARIWRQMAEYSHLKITGVFTHFARADEPENEMTPNQLKAFETALSDCEISHREYCVHAANSAAALQFPDSHFGAVRCGIALYGANPIGAQAEPKLKPVMSLRARVTEVRKLRRGDSVSYGATWRAGRDSALAVVPLGYADGYLRGLSNKGEVLVRGRRARVAGRVTMDQILIDVTEYSPRVQVGEMVTAWGRDENNNELRVEEVADLAETIPYELMCRVAPRVPRLYLNEAGNRLSITEH